MNTLTRMARPAAVFATLAAAGTLAAPAWAQTPPQFTAIGEAVSYQDGHATHVPNTLYYRHGNIRLDMAQPVNTDSSAAFSVVLAHEGGKSITLLNTKQRQAMKLDAHSLQSVTENPSLQKISAFKLSEFGKTFRAHAKAIGTETVAGEPCTILDHKGKDGHFKLWLSNRYDLPLRFTYFEGSKPAFTYSCSKLTLSANLPSSAFKVPAGYQETDLTQVLNGLDQSHH